MQSRALLPSVFSATTFTALQRRHVDLMFVALLAAATPALTYLEAANGTLPGAAEIAAGTHVHSPPFTLLYSEEHYDGYDGDTYYAISVTSLSQLLAFSHAANVNGEQRAEATTIDVRSECSSSTAPSSSSSSTSTVSSSTVS